jgi:hypothetical protein
VIKINKKDLLNLKTLLIDGTITYGKFDNKDIVTNLELNGSIKLIRKSPQRKILHLEKKENVYLFLKNNGYKIEDIINFDTYLKEIVETTPSRDTIHKWHNCTKIKKSESLKGLYLSSLHNLNIKIDNKPVTIIPTNGVGYFCFYTQEITLSEDTIVVGVENYQVIWFAKKYKDFFINTKVLFVVRNKYMREWIETIENEYIHFGDYDLAGINIYLNDIVPRLKKSKKYSMFIPDNIEYLIKEYGDSDIFQKQIKYKDIVVNDLKIDKLKKIIKKYKKGLEQEGLYYLTFGDSDEK